MIIFHHLKNLSPSHVRSSQTERKRGGRVIRSTIWKRIEDLNSEILKNCEILITNILQHSKCLRQNQIYQRIATQPKSVQRFHDCGMSFSIFDMKGSLLPNRNKRLEQTCRRLKLQWFKHSSICNLVRILLSMSTPSIETFTFQFFPSFEKQFPLYFWFLDGISVILLFTNVAIWQKISTVQNKVAKLISFLFYFGNISFKVKPVDVSPSWVQNRNPGSSLFQQVCGEMIEL